MSSMDFQTAAQQRTFEGEEEAITLDGRTMVVRKPGSAQMALVLSAARKGQLDRVLNFFLAMFPEEADKQHLMDRLEDPDDPLDLYDEIDPENTTSAYLIIKRLMEKWSARPTQSSSGSGRSQKNTGKPSTAGARPKARRRSTSPSTAS